MDKLTPENLREIFIKLQDGNLDAVLVGRQAVKSNPLKTMLNPILYTEKVLSDFLKYQLTTYPFADHNLHEQMRQLLSLEHTRNTPLFKGPYISLSRIFQEGAPVTQLVAENLLHPHLSHLIPYPTLYGHQETAIRAISQQQPTLVSTGTGSGKTECFLYPIISHCLDLRDQSAPMASLP